MSGEAWRRIGALEGRGSEVDRRLSNLEAAVDGLRKIDRDRAAVEQATASRRRDRHARLKLAVGGIGALSAIGAVTLAAIRLIGGAG